MSIINEISLELRRLGLDFVLSFEELDPQYLAVKNLCRSLGSVNNTLILTILNALVSYQLSGKGEDHWNYFSTYFINNPPGNDLCGDFIKYIFASKYLVRFRDSRINRVKRVCNSLVSLLSNKAGNYMNDLNTLWGLIAKVVGAKGIEKTVVFALKMSYYVGRACGFNVRVPQNVPIPVDFRVTLITICSGLLGNFEGDPIELARIWMSKRRNDVQRVWNEVSRLSGIPPLNLDSLVWVLGGALIRSSFKLEDALHYVGGLGIDAEKVKGLMSLMISHCKPK